LSYFTEDEIINRLEKYIKIDHKPHTYKYWTAVRFAKVGEISPFRLLKDMFLHNKYRVAQLIRQNSQTTSFFLFPFKRVPA
jgi:hypothetical protein